MNSTTYTQLGSLQRLQQLIPKLPKASSDVLLDRIVRTSAFLRGVKGCNLEPLDEEKLLLLAEVYKSCVATRPKLTTVLEAALFYIKQNADLLMKDSPYSFVESFLGALHDAADMKRHVVETIIGMFKKLHLYVPDRRISALKRLSLFVARHTLAKHFILHPSSTVVADVLLAHISISYSDDLSALSAARKSDIIYHGLVGLRAVLNTYLHHISVSSSPSKRANTELSTLVERASAASKAIFQSSRPCDRALKVKVEAVRLLLTGARWEEALYPLGYQAAVHLLRACINDKEPFGHVVPTVHSEPVVNDGDRRGRLRAMTDAAVMASPRRDLISDVVPESPMVSKASMLPQKPTYKDIDDDAVALSPVKMNLFLLLGRALFRGASAYLRKENTTSSSESIDGTAQETAENIRKCSQSALLALSQCLLFFITNHDELLRCVSLPHRPSIHHLLGIHPEAVGAPADEGLTPTDFYNVFSAHSVQFEETLPSCERGSDSRDNLSSGQRSDSPIIYDDVKPIKSGPHIDVNNGDRFRQRKPSYTFSELVYLSLIDLSQSVIRFYSINFNSTLSLNLFKQLTQDMFFTLEELHLESKETRKALENGAQPVSPNPVKLTVAHQRVLYTLDYMATLISRSSLDPSSTDLTPSFCFRHASEMLSYTSHPVIMNHLVLFINKCVQSSRGLARVGAPPETLFNITFDLYCATFARSFGLVLNAISAGDMVKLVAGTISRNPMNDHNQRLSTANGVLRSIQEGVSDLLLKSGLVDATDKMKVKSIDSLLTGYRDLIAIQKSLLNLFVELCNHLLQKALECCLVCKKEKLFFQFLLGTWTHHETVYDLSYISFLAGMLRPLADVFESIYNIKYLLSDRILEDMENEELPNWLNRLISTDQTDLILLRAFWTYIGLFRLVDTSSPVYHSSLIEHIRRISYFSDNLVSNSKHPFLELYTNCIKSQKLTDERWERVVFPTSRGQNLVLELRLCPVDRVLVVCSTKPASDKHAEVLDKSIYRWLQGIVVANVNCISTKCFWDSRGKFPIPTVLFESQKGDNHISPIGDLLRSAKEVVGTIKGCKLTKLSLSMRLFLTAVDSLESLRLDSDLSCTTPKKRTSICEVLLSYVYDVYVHSRSKIEPDEDHFRNSVGALAISMWRSWAERCGRATMGSKLWSSSSVSSSVRDRALDNMKFLLQKYSDPYVNERYHQNTLCYIYVLLNNCPWCVWNNGMLSHLLSRCDALENTRLQMNDNIVRQSASTKTLSSSEVLDISVAYLQLVYHWCCIGLHFYPDLMVSNITDFRMLASHPPFRSPNSSGNGRVESNINGSLGVQIAIEMSGADGVPIYHTVHGVDVNPSILFPIGFNRSYTHLDSEVLAGARRVAAADVARHFRLNNFSPNPNLNEEIASSIFPAVSPVDHTVLHLIDLSSRAYALGLLTNSSISKTDRNAFSSDLNFEKANRTLLLMDLNAAFVCCQEVLVSYVTENISTEESPEMHSKMSSFIKQLEQNIVTTAGFIYLSVACNKNDGLVLSALNLLSEYLCLCFTEATAKIVIGSFHWLISAFPEELLKLVLLETSKVMQWSAEMSFGIFSKRDSVNVSQQSTEQSPLIAVPSVFAEPPNPIEERTNYLPLMGDQLSAHTVIIDFFENIFRSVLHDSDFDSILFSCWETVLIKSSIYPSLYFVSSVTVSNYNKSSGSCDVVGKMAPLFRFLSLGLQLLDCISRINNEVHQDGGGVLVGGSYNNTTLLVTRYCHGNNLHIRTSTAGNEKLKEVITNFSSYYLPCYLSKSTWSVSSSRRLAFRERVYAIALTWFNAPHHSLNSTPMFNTSLMDRLGPSRDIDIEIKTVLDFMDCLQNDANTWWQYDYSNSNEASTQYVQSRAGGPYEVMRWLDGILFHTDRSKQQREDLQSVLFNPRSIITHQLSLGNPQLKIRPPEAEPDARVPESIVRLQRFCGIEIDFSGPLYFGKSDLRHSAKGVLHLIKMCLHVELDRMYAWQSIKHEQIVRKQGVGPDQSESDASFSIINYNISRRADVMNYFRNVCCSKSGIHAAVLSAWSFHPALALRLDAAFQYRSLTSENSAIYKSRLRYVMQTLLSDSFGFGPSKEPPSLDGISHLLQHELYEMCWPRISDLIAHNPVALRADFYSVGYLLGIVGDVTFQNAGGSIKRNKRKNNGDRAISELRMWALYGDKSIPTVFNRIVGTAADQFQRRIDSLQELDYRHISQLKQKHRRTLKNTISHRSVHCPMYLISHWALAPPDYAISLLQRPILRHTGKTIDIHSKEESDDKLLEIWHEQLAAQYFVVQYVIRSLSVLDPETLLFYLPQLVQLLRRDKLGSIRQFLEWKAKSSDLLCHQLVWLLETESVSGGDDEKPHAKKEVSKHAESKADIIVNADLTILNDKRHGYCNQLVGQDPLPMEAQSLHKLVVSALSRRALNYMKLECEYFNTVTHISAKLALVRDKDLHNGMISNELCKIGLKKGLYLPTDPHRLVVDVDVTSGTPMQSAAKCPFLLVFHTLPWDGPDSLQEAVEDELQLLLPEKNIFLDGAASGNFNRAKSVHASILSKKEPQVLQKVRVRKSSMEAVPDTSLEMHHIELGNENDNLADEESDDESDDFGDVPIRVRTKSKDYRTLLVHNSGDNTDDVELSTLSSATGTKDSQSYASKTFNAAVTFREFNKSVSILSRGRALRKGTNKWYQNWEESPQKNYYAHVESISNNPSSSNDHHQGDRQKKSEKPSKTACIFKVYDDCRQDALTIQFIRILYDAFTLDHKMPLYLYPYRVVPNRTGSDKAMGGIIQVIPDVRSRDDIGKSGAKTLLQYFRSMYGPEHSVAFRQAQRSFACSQAAYAVVSYLLQIKDRHNGNLVIDKEGHVIHIDFGFLLGISPGRNLGFETAAFKFSNEMFELLGGSIHAEPYVYFVDMTVKAFLIARELKQSLVAIIASFADSGLPCFNYRSDNIEVLLSRFWPELNDVDAAIQMRLLINDACRKWTTIVYDGIQKLQNNIYSDTWK